MTHRSPCILVVEDQRLLRAFTVMELAGAGLDVIEADDADHAVRQLESHPEVTTVFTDINMPGQLDGLELAKWVAKVRPGVRLILTSGRRQPSRAEMPSGARFLPKPYDPALLTALLQG